MYFKRILPIVSLLFLLFLAACGGTEPATDVVEEPAAEIEEPAAVVEEPVAEEPAAETEEVVAEASPEPTEEPAPVGPTANLTDGCVESYDENVDYFPEKVDANFTEGFSVEYHNNYKILTVDTPFPGAEEAVTYVLVQCGTPVPEGMDDAVIIETPINSFVGMSTSYLPFLDELGLVDTIVGLDSLDFVTTESVRAKIDAGELVEIGAGAEVNVEAVLDLEPALVMTYGSGFPDYDAHPVLQEAGITVVLNAEYLDLSPLGRTEWVKFLAAFYNAEGAANVWFDEIVIEYEALQALVADVEEKPTVFANTPFEGTWYMPGGNSFVAEQLVDAGATYLWADDESTSTQFLDFETVFDVASEAEYWINIGFFGSLADLEAADARYADFVAFQNGGVFNNDARTNEFGGNDYWEGGIANPHLILSDLIKIFHPELMTDVEFVYYRLVE
ncbi:MAG: ABC transporter substrate-binding protein [Chloroflexi bacterium]|nr:ABC transporter substrate-binding protein [Chloroflexota bacterium]